MDQRVGARVTTTNDLPQGTGVLLHSGALVVMQVHYNLLHAHPHVASPTVRSVVLKLRARGRLDLTPLDTFLAPAPVELPCPAGTARRSAPATPPTASEVKKYGQDAAFISIGLLYLCKKTMADYPSAGRRRAQRRHVVRPHRQPAAAHLRRRRPHAPARRRHPHRAESRHAARADAAAHPALGLPLAGRVLPRASRRRRHRRHDPRHCRFDNSRGAQPVVDGKRLAPRYVLWGEGTTDEMCLGLLQVATRECSTTRVRAVLERLEREDAEERERGVPASERLAPGRARRPAASSSRSSRRRPTARCSRSVARAATRRSGSRRACAISAAACSRSSTTRARSRPGARNIAEAGLEEWAELVEGDARETLPEIDDVFDVVFLDAEKDDYESLFALARGKVEPGGALRRRQRALAPGSARAVLGGPAGRSDLVSSPSRSTAASS